MRKLIDFMRNHVLGAMFASGVFGVVATAIFSDYTNFRSSERALIQADYDKARAVQSDMDSTLQKFADNALGKSTTTAEDANALRKAIKDAYADAEQLTMRLPSLKSEFDVLADSLISLQKAALELKGPANAKGFLLAIDHYYVARDAFNRAAVEAQGKWLALN